MSFVVTPCANCGGVDYEKLSGQYICQNCDTQSQDIEEQSFELFTDAAAYIEQGHDEKEEIISQKIDEERKLTSWECYNLILKGLVDELILLGAQPRLKKTAFQLWALFLHKEQAAFFSKTEAVLPSLPITFKNKDIEVLYGVKSFRKMYLKDLQKMRNDNNRVKNSKDSKRKADAESSETESDLDDSRTSRKSTRSLRRKQRKLAMSVLENESLSLNFRNDLGVISSDTERVDIGKPRKTKKEVKISFRSSAREWMEKLAKQFEKTKRKYNNDLEKIPQNIRRIYANRIYSRNDRIYPKKKSPTQPINLQLSINLILAILRLALLLIEDNIQWADIFRWSCEGRLSSFRVNQFLPKNAVVRHTDLNAAMRNNLICHEMRRITGLLDITDIPAPDLFVMVQRYMFELCLPNEFVEFTKKMMAIFPPHMDYLHFENRTFPDYECRTMAYVLFVFKLLFSLDDVTETKQSAFANAVNRHNDKTTSGGIPILFSWTDWTRYIECRKALLSRYDVTMNCLCESGASPTNSAFLEFWRNTEPDTGDAVPSQRINKNLITELEMAAKRFHSNHVKIDTDVTINFPSSMTPFRTYTQHLIENHPDLLSNRSHRILSTDFSSYSIRYLLDSEWTKALGNELSLTVDSVLGTAVEDMKPFKEPRRNVPQLSKRKVIPAHVPTPVRVLDDRKRKKEKKTVKKFYPEFKSFDSNSNESESQNSSFEVNYPSCKYWLFHDKMSRTSGDKFNQYAKSNLSVSFLYLLRECSRVVRCDTQTLYDELVAIEFAYACLFSDNHEYCQEANFVFLPNEW